MIRRVLIGRAHVLRALAVALAALSLAWGVTLTEGLIAAMLGAAAGSIAGQHLARSKLRLGAALAACALGLLAAWAAATIAVGTEALPALIGPGNTLRITACLRFGALSFATAAALRAVAARKPAALAIELGFVALSIATVFAAHRDGIIARPLWLSDWAWRQGIDPARILLGIGGLAAGILAILLLLETKSERPVSSLIVVTALAIVAAASINTWAMPAPDPLNDLGLNGASGEQDRPPGGKPGVDAGGSTGAQGSGGGGGSGGSTGSGSGSGTGGVERAPVAAEDSRGGSIPSGTAPLGTASADASDGADGSPSPERGGRAPSASSRDELSDDAPEDQSPSTSPAPMAVVLLENDYSPPSQAYYFREDALSQYNGSRLVVSSLAGTDLDIPSGFPAEAMPVLAPPSTEGRERVRTTVVLLTEHSKPFALESPALLEPAPNPNPSRFTRAYRVESLSQIIDYKDLSGRPSGDKAWAPEVRAHYTAPPSDPRYTELARRIASGLPSDVRTDPFALAVGVKLYLDKEVTYSTAAKHAGVPDPTADMLFGDRIGYCVHFAHAAVFLWRALGIPARVGVGYRSEEDNRKGGSAILLRSGDAHAWPELYLEGAGWIVLDIAPAQNLDTPRPAVDDELQRLLGQMARGEPPDQPEDRGKPLKLRQILRWIGGAGVLLVAIAVILLYLIKLWRRLSPRFADARSLPIISYRSALDLLAEAGFTRHFGETREAFASRARPLSPAFEDLTWMHLSSRLGKKHPTAPAPSPNEWRAALTRVRSDIAQRGSLFRRLLGALNPASFLDAR